jgi:uncharacterized protein (TIGR02271 family)
LGSLRSGPSIRVGVNVLNDLFSSFDLLPTRERGMGVARILVLGSAQQKEGGMADVKDEGLVSLDDGGWEVAEGEPDVRGWDVVTVDDKKIGEVDDLLADPSAMKVRYLTIDLDRDFATAQADKTVRVPISDARVHESERKVVLNVSGANLKNLATAKPQAWRDDQIKLTRSAEELRVGKRQVEAGEVEVKKRVETEHVKQPVTLRHEEVEIERRPVTGSAPSRDVQISAQEIRVPVTEEEAVVEKRPVVKEEVVISKHPVEERETVEADVRKERIDIERHGDVRARERNERDRTK